MEITSRIIKGGALLEDSRRFIDAWNPNLAPNDNLAAFRASNMLAKRSRSRTEDTLAVLRQRFVADDPEVVSALKLLTRRADAFREGCYFEAARNDDLLGYVAAEVFYGLRNRGWIKVSVADVERALLDSPPAPAVKEWADDTRRRVVHGLLSALRDFHVLEGRVIKHLAPPRLTFPGFVYVLGRLRTLTGSSHEIVTSSVWRWWLLDPPQVRGLLLQADRHGFMRYSEAGSVARIDWRMEGLEEMVHAAV